MIPKSIANQMTGIEWADFTGNPWIGCTRVPASSGARSGCDICYAATFAGNRLGVAWGAEQPRRQASSFAARMRRLNRLALQTGLPFSVFSLSLGDWLDPEIDSAWRRAFIAIVEECQALTWLLLTHRPHLTGKLAPPDWRQSPPANVWPGVTVDHPRHAFRWVQHAEYWAHTGRAWVSAEPLAASLNEVHFKDFAVIVFGGASNTDDSSWEFRDRWVEEAVDRYGPDKLFFKQRGDIVNGLRIGKKAAGRDIRGRLYDRTPWPRHRDILISAAYPGYT